MSAEVPIGTIIIWGGQKTNIPPGWLYCDGTIVEISQYQELYSVIGPSFGNPTTGHFDPRTQFFLPDLRGYFLRGVDDGAKRDPDFKDRTDMQGGQTVGPQVGSVQGDQLRSHSHTYTMYPFDHGDISSGNHFKQGDTQTTPTGGNETRPCNAYVYFLIKAH